MRSTQSGRGFVEIGERRDRFVSAGVKGHLPLRSVVRVEPVGGIVLNLPGNASFAGSRAGYADLAWNLGFMFGGDVRIGRGRVAVIPGFRIVYTTVSRGTTYIEGFSGDLINFGDQDIAAIYGGGYPKWTQRASLALRVNF